MKRRAAIAASGFAAGQAARGFTLIVSLILLVIITLVAAASMRTVSLQSRMSAATHDRNIVYQASESGLREAEARAAATAPTAFPASGCSAGLCAQSAPSATPRWADPSSAGWVATTAPNSANAPVSESIVEPNGSGENWPGCAQAMPPIPNCLTPRYRVTSRAGATGRGNVILQSDLASP